MRYSEWVSSSSPCEAPAGAVFLSHESPQRATAVFNRSTPMGSIADTFQARLKALEMQSAETDRRVAETIAHCHQLIAEQEQAERQWRAAHPELL